MKIDYKKLDNEDIFIRSSPWTPEEKKAFSEFLKARKEKKSRRKIAHEYSRKPTENREIGGLLSVSHEQD
jgi:hypothetical protein